MGLVSGIGAKRGSAKESKGYREAAGFMKQLGEEAGKTQKMADPWSEYRSGYATQLNDILQGNREWTTDPGYNFRMQEDQRAIERSGFAKGHGMSGNMAAALQQRSQDIASAEYNNIINRLIGLSAATPENAAAGASLYGNMMTTSLTGQADAAIGRRNAQARGTAAMYQGIENTMYDLMNYFIPGSNGQWGASSGKGGTSGSLWGGGMMGGGSGVAQGGQGGSAQGNSMGGGLSSIAGFF